MKSLLILGLDPFNFFLIGTFLVLSIVFWFTRFGRSSTWLQYIGMISGLGVSVFVLQFVIQNQRQHEQTRKDRALSFTIMTERYVINLEKWFAEQYPYTTRLYKELYPGHPGLAKVEVPAEIDVTKQAEIEAHICGILIQAVEDVYWVEQLEKNYTDPDLAGWMVTFKRWFSSAILRGQWAYLKDNYGTVFQRFVDTKLINPEKMIKK